MIGQLTNDEKYCPRVQGGKLLPDLRALIDGTFYVHDNKDVKDVYLYFSKAFTKLNLTKYDTLEVDTVIAKNLFASKFTLRQTSFQNGDLMVSDGGIVDAVNGLELTFKDQSGFNVCAFAIGDLIEAHSVRADNSLAITNPQGTVTEVIGNKVKITYYSTSAFKKGDEVYRVGNTTDATRRDSLYFSTNRTNTPYFDVYDNIDSFDTVGSPTTAWTSAVPKVRIGNLAGITDADFGGALSGYGIYTQRGYFKGDVKITNQGSISISGFNNDAGFITASQAAHTFYQATEPTTMVTGDFWFNTTAGVMRMKRYNGTSWATSPYVSVYMDANGLYAGSITAGQITSGEITALTYQTDTGLAGHYKRAVLSASTNDIKWYDASNVNVVRIGENVIGSNPGISLDSGASLFINNDVSRTYAAKITNSITGLAGNWWAIDAEIGGTNNAASTAYALFGQSSATNPNALGVNVGVYGSATGATTNWAGYFEGNLKSTGTIYQGTDAVATQSWVGSQGYLTSYTETDPNVYAWAKAATKPTYTYTEVGAAASGHNHTGVYLPYVSGGVTGSTELLDSDGVTIWHISFSGGVCTDLSIIP